ncbi:SGNH/GDSL hydrolase family protein [Listeria fleischmannii]|uniref:Lipase/acylhydrolase n=1 Tax=Listeria fleischmannii FSL S10-1203 TaxID=1265822 RepID=W7DPM5_9LIST|nr:SGNH/GDSL hydrolase family protein [Listeria fleischmannii]EUJ62889.1 lipase/acylhydrolase [Listeria fleischmannii FSL S10-1203]MBC1419946.1 SGNH/GDSL hydrolase family protein [Listeria fleischmannii]
METILFQGDSITDAGRNRADTGSLGNGYVEMIARRLPEFRVLNRGVSGDLTTDMRARFEKDAISLAPDYISILIGINDTWRSFSEWRDTSTSAYRAIYTEVLEETVQKTDAKLILMEPFVLPIPQDRKEWRADLDPKIQVVRELASKYQALYVPLDGMLNAAGIAQGYAEIAPDGVHPTKRGHELIAEAWYSSFTSFTKK